MKNASILYAKSKITRSKYVHGYSPMVSHGTGKFSSWLIFNTQQCPSLKPSDISKLPLEMNKGHGS